MTEQIKAYAKINLHLDIKSKRDDGFHEVEMLMQSVSLCDTVSVTLTETAEFFAECNVEDVPTGDKNIAVRAAKLFVRRAELDCGARITIEKRIPMAAGLAGGSTDAAAVLVAMNRLCNDRFSYSELCDMAAELGSDVPFCISGGCAYSEGRGEILTPFLPIPSNTVFVIACGGEGVSTPWAYGLMDETFNDFRNYSVKGIQAFEETLKSDRPEDFYKHLFNIFEAPVMAHRPAVAHMRETMLQNGARAAMMSGSGPSVFGVFENKNEAETARKALENSGCFACVCAPEATRNIKK